MKDKGVGFTWQKFVDEKAHRTLATQKSFAHLVRPRCKTEIETVCHWPHSGTTWFPILFEISLRHKGLQNGRSLILYGPKTFGVETVPF